MLPVSPRHRLAIPHRLAMIAAAVCLTLAFSANQLAASKSLEAESLAAQCDSEQVAGSTAGSSTAEDQEQVLRRRLKLLPLIF